MSRRQPREGRTKQGDVQVPSLQGEMQLLGGEEVRMAGAEGKRVRAEAREGPGPDYRAGNEGFTLRALGSYGRILNRGSNPQDLCKDIRHAVNTLLSD